METAIRFSQNSLAGSDQRFLYADLGTKSVKLCQITSQNRGLVQYETLHSSTKVPTFRAFDWHPINETLVVVGQAGGEATLLNITEGQQDSVSFQVRSQRLCNAVAISSLNLLAAGLDRVRTDFCLNVWDFNQRLPVPGSKGFSKNYAEPLHKLAPGEPIASIKFFQDDPQLLVAGVKGQFVRLYDLREPAANNGLQFATRCVHNLTIDWHDENYFASCYPTNDPSICVWDRRMLAKSGSTGFGASGHSENRPAEVSLELKNAIENPGTIWSLRFSKSKSCSVGALSSTGHLRVFELGKDFAPPSKSDENEDHSEFAWRNTLPQEVYLDQSQDIEHNYTYPLTPRHEKTRIVSFDFMTNRSSINEQMILTLNGHGELRITSTKPWPEPVRFGSLNYLWRGHKSIHASVPANMDVPQVISQIKSRAEHNNIMRKSFKQSKPSKTIDIQKMSSIANQAWYTDLGFYEKGVPVQDLLLLISLQRLRCEAGYLFDPTKNRSIVSDSQWLQAFWGWLDRANRISRHGSLSQDNFDLSNVGVFGFWMEDIQQKNRTLGPCSSRITKIVENLVKRLNIPIGHLCSTEYQYNRQICLYVSGLAWSNEELEERTRRLVSQNQHSKAAALAMFSGERKLAYKVLRVKSATQSHKMLAMALAGSAKRAKADEPIKASDLDVDWSDTIKSLADELTDPYARAILAYVKSEDWADVIYVESLPLKYRVGVALRHFDDSKLTRYISQSTKEAIVAGDLEGVALTGIGTNEAFELLSNYVTRFGDLQTAVLALCGSVPRYLDDEKTVRKFTAWKQEYRWMMNSWGLKFDRVRFDIASQRLAVDSGGRRLIEPAKPQIQLVCGFCSKSIAHHENNGENNNIAENDNGVRRRNGDSLSTHSQSQLQSQHHSMHDTITNPLTSDKAASTGTVCPKCGRHLPRCGVCDLWLGTPDETYLKWYGEHYLQKQNQKSIDMSASLSGSFQTTLGSSTGMLSNIKDRLTDSPKPKQVKALAGPGIGGEVMSREGSHQSMTQQRQEAGPGKGKIHSSERSVREDPNEALPSNLTSEISDLDEVFDTAMSRFTVFCVKCCHGFHASHARIWFKGRNGSQGHRICPVPKCECLCYG